MPVALYVLFFGVIAVAHKGSDHIVTRFGDVRYQYMTSANKKMHLVNTWAMTSHYKMSLRYKPDVENVYYLFTRENPSESQPLRLHDHDQLLLSNYDPARRTIILVHGWTDNIEGNFYKVVVPAYLEAEDVNVICVDWSAGGGTINYVVAVLNTVKSGESVARFVDWVNEVTGSDPLQYHIVGHSLGGHQAGIIGRNVDGVIAYITALDPALPGWIINSNKFRSTDAAYTEVIHTNAGLLGYHFPLGQVDFYPNGGGTMPGCWEPSCHHSRCFQYMAESLRSGRFMGIGCYNYTSAMTGHCHLKKRKVVMGGSKPKPGIFSFAAYLEAEDVNVICVDWSAGGGTINYVVAVLNTVKSGESVARFVDWVNEVTGSDPLQYHIVGHSLGGHQAGIIGRNVDGVIAYITALDPALPGWIINSNKFRSTDAAYTEVIHTNAGLLGYHFPLGQVDFYPNGGGTMPGCWEPSCHHSRCFQYMAESLRSGRFMGIGCYNYTSAMTGHCHLKKRKVVMGGSKPKPGYLGIFYVETNAEPPFSRL